MNWKDTDSPEFPQMAEHAKSRVQARREICEKCEQFSRFQNDDVHCKIGKVCCGGKVNEGPVSLTWSQCPQHRWCKTMFKKSYVISLKRTPYRLDQFWDRFKLIQWPFVMPELFEAMDGDKLPTPSGAVNSQISIMRREINEILTRSKDQVLKDNITKVMMKVSETQNIWIAGGGAWGCMESHRQILRNCIMNNIDSVFIFEDDAEPAPDFMTRLPSFLENLPPDWDGIMLGGQHFSDPVPVADGVVRTRGMVNRTHAYGVRGNLLRELYAMWHSYFGHCDHGMGYIFDKFKVYTPSPFLIGQGKNQSQITGRAEPARFWSGNDKKSKVILLHCSHEVLKGLRSEGIHTGYSRNDNDVDVGLAKVFESGTSPTGMARELRQWIDLIGHEAAAFEKGVGAIWYPPLDQKCLQAVRLALGSDYIELRINSTESYIRERDRHVLVATG